MYLKVEFNFPALKVAIQKHFAGEAVKF